MKTKRFIRIPVWCAALAVAFGLGTAVGQQAPPTDTKGIQVTQTSAIDLGSLEGTQGRQLRLRLITFEPGAVVAIHSHKERPAFAYILQGTLTEYREGGYMKEYREGEFITETPAVTHWAVNNGTKPVVLVGVDVFKP